MSENLETVRSLYEAFRTRNIDRMLEIFDPEIEWSVPKTEGIPWGGTYKGYDGVMAFFKRLMGAINATVDPDELIDADEYIAAVGYSGGTVRQTGKEFTVPAVHIWRFRNGRIVAGQGYFDFPQMREVLKGVDLEAGDEAGPPAGPPSAPPPSGAAATGTHRYALLYPFKPGKAAEADEIFRAGGDPPPQAGGATKLRSTTVLRKGDTVVRVFEIEGSLEEAVEHMVRAAALSDVGTRLRPLLQDTADLTSEEGLRRFFSEQMMEVITDRGGPPGAR